MTSSPFSGLTSEKWLALNKNQQMSLFCQGMENICEKLAETAEDKFQQEKFIKQANDFGSLGKIFDAVKPVSKKRGRKSKMKGFA